MQEKSNQDTKSRVRNKEEYYRKEIDKSSHSRGRNVHRKNRDKKTGINKCRLYIGNLNYSISSAEITRTFETFGTIVSYDLKTGYAFVVFIIILIFIPRNTKIQSKQKKPRRK